VLIVDDDLPIREALRALLEGEGYDVEEAENGRVALDRVRGGQAPAVVLLDLMMPVMTGGEFLRAVKHDPLTVRIPIIVMTAWRSGATGITGVPPDGYLRKPLNVDALLSMVRGFCDA
jgi:CheY-like chemotaxis protein